MLSSPLASQPAIHAFVLTWWQRRCIDQVGSRWPPSFPGLTNLSFLLLSLFSLARFGSKLFGQFFYPAAVCFSLPVRDRPIFDMLRLRPSEITLTPADVEESRRRMARKQAALPVANRSTRVPRPPARPPGPRLRRGPEHSRDDAITRLGNIPVLRPHQVIHDATGGDPEDVFAIPSQHESQTRINIVPAASLPTEQTAPTPRINATEASTIHTMQLAFRPAPARLVERENTEEGMSSSPPKDTSGDVGFGRPRTNTSEETNERTAQSLIPASADGFAETPDRGLSGRGRVRSVRQYSNHAPTPPHHTHAVSSPRQQQDTMHRNNDTSIGALPAVYLQGYFASPEEYTFREYPMVPRTEPRLRPERPTQMSRTMSSNSDSHPGLGRRWDQSQPSSATEDVFWTPPTSSHPQREPSDSIDRIERDRRRTSLEEQILSGEHDINELVHDHYQGLFGRVRAAQAGHHASSGLEVNRHTSSQRFSEASSSSSLPYSYYELPVSRHSSSNHSQGDQLLQSQYDGAAPSREVSRGTYLSIQPSRVHLRPPAARNSSYSSPNLVVALGQHGMSPAPASPYSHGPKGSARQHHKEATGDSRIQLGPLTGLVNSQDFAGEDRDASSAAQRDLSSPLELLEQRASSHLSRISTVTYPAFSSSQRSSEAQSVFRYQVADFDEQQQRRRTSGSEGLREGSGNNTRSQITTPRRYPVRTRAGQSSSENIPVATQVTLGDIQNAPIAHAGSMRGGYIQTSPIPLRFNNPQTSSPPDFSARPQLQSPYQQGSTVHLPRDPDRDSNLYSSSPTSPFQDYRHVSQRHGYTPPLRHHRSIPHEGEPQRRNPLRAFPEPHLYHERHDLPHPISLRHLERASIAPAIGQGAGSRRPVNTRVATSRRRITHQQQNQENSGDAEAGLMREEILAGGMRYADDGQQLDVMDETPPRLGRFERHILG
ncbi:hypothetical protein K505DRAFT_398576 [Melanomma pulvis-pyrius CBS 109.77]|uniref:Uncharacterized protein n=1 Tax=Melanomma pulvis-pyrius CBS 109.77 TaxID=1314802 RepID=A0A6A6XW59_9PLEO|nr:hypothetical protein K505DRAFT_398576 [Melanomma pulvis-pyrius CBS 109.77]